MTEAQGEFLTPEICKIGIELLKLAKDILPEREKTKDPQPSSKNYQSLKALLPLLPKCKKGIHDYLIILSNDPKTKKKYKNPNYDQFFEIYYSSITSIEPNSGLHIGLEESFFLFTDYNKLCMNLSSTDKRSMTGIKRQLDELEFRWILCFEKIHQNVYLLL